jgi:glycosyltransferase involved in cell wall biosynthesis
VTYNIPVYAAMTLLAHSKFMVLPLKNAEVPCGHVTLVAAFHLGKATVITESAGIDDYLGDGTFTRACKANDPQSLAREIETLWMDDELVSDMGCRAKAFAEMHCSEQVALSYLDDLLKREGL